MNLKQKVCERKITIFYKVCNFYFYLHKKVCNYFFIKIMIISILCFKSVQNSVNTHIIYT